MRHYEVNNIGKMYLQHVNTQSVNASTFFNSQSVENSSGCLVYDPNLQKVFFSNGVSWIGVGNDSSETVTKLFSIPTTLTSLNLGRAVSFVNGTWTLANPNQFNTCARGILHKFFNSTSYTIMFQGYRMYSDSEQQNYTSGKYYSIDAGGAFIDRDSSDAKQYNFDNTLFYAITSTSGIILNWKPECRIVDGGTF